jgi:2,5-diketo-D-gluconate reductase B
MQTFVSQGITIPRIGLGTFRMTGDACRFAVESALELGYRSIDTAEMYANEDAVGAAIAASGVHRDDLHLTTKVWHTNLSRDSIRTALSRSLDRLRTDYVDLYMVHWPSTDMAFNTIFDTLQQVKKEGLARSIGVCNFTMPMIRKVVEELRIPIFCNQVEYHVLLDQAPMREYLVSHGMLLIAHCPLAQGTLANNPVLVRIAEKYRVHPAQVALRWLLMQDGLVVIPKAQRLDTQTMNLHSFDVTLDLEDLAAIDSLPKRQRFVNPPFAPVWDHPSH